MAIPSAAHWGVHSARAVDNFPISGHAVAQMPELVRALAFVKRAAAQTNVELGVIDAGRASAIVQACDDFIGGALHDQFVVDVIQGGAGTSTNMNANEVVANRALGVRADSNIGELPGFEGKKLVSTRGTTPLKAITAANRVTACFASTSSKPLTMPGRWRGSSAGKPMASRWMT